VCAAFARFPWVLAGAASRGGETPPKSNRSTPTRAIYCYTKDVSVIVDC